MTTYLLDANVLIALTVAEHEHHETASEWLATVDEFATCPVVEGALVRFLVRMGESFATASSILAGVQTHERHTFWPDSLSYARIDGTSVRGHRQVTDTYLAAMAGASSGHLATFDQALAERLPAHCFLVAPVSDKSA